MPINWTDEQLAKAKINKRKLKAIVDRFEKLSLEMQAMGLYVYGASGSGHLIHHSRPTHTDSGWNMEQDQGSSVASIGFGFDGGDW